MKAELVCASRELFGADRSAIRLGALLQSLGVDVRLTVPAHRPERGLQQLAEQHRLAVDRARVVVASSRGLGGVLAGGDQIGGQADLTIYNSAAVVTRVGDRGPRALVLREWMSRRRLRHRALCALHRRRLEVVVAVSEGVAQRWRSCAGDAIPVEVCPNWIDESWLTSGEETERSGILFAGRLNAWKGQKVLADAFEAGFAGAGSRPSLTFLGAEGQGSPFHGEALELERRCARMGWRLLPFTPEPIETFRRAALVVVPSLRPEPFGNVILEGLAAGARVLAFRGGGVDDLAPLFGDALRVVERKPGALAAELRRWWLEGASAQSASEHERTLAGLRDGFTAHSATARWQRVIDGLCGG